MIIFIELEADRAQSIHTTQSKPTLFHPKTTPPKTSCPSQNTPIYNTQSKPHTPPVSPLRLPPPSTTSTHNGRHHLIHNLRRPRTKPNQQAHPRPQKETQPYPPNGRVHLSGQTHQQRTRRSSPLQTFRRCPHRRAREASHSSLLRPRRRTQPRPQQQTPTPT